MVRLRAVQLATTFVPLNMRLECGMLGFTNSIPLRKDETEKEAIETGRTWWSCGEVARNDIVATSETEGEMEYG